MFPSLSDSRSIFNKEFNIWFSSSADMAPLQLVVGRAPSRIVVVVANTPIGREVTELKQRVVRAGIHGIRGIRKLLAIERKETTSWTCDVFRLRKSEGGLVWHVETELEVRVSHPTRPSSQHQPASGGPRPASPLF